MGNIDLASRILGWHLGLGDLNQPHRCKTYQNGCVCPVCRAHREQVRLRGFTADGKLAALPPKRQPWGAEAA